MAKLHFLADDVKVEAEPGESLLDASLAAGITHTHVCGRRARCSTCRVMVIEGIQHCSPRTPEEAKLAEMLHFGPEVRLACQTFVFGDATLRRLVLDDDDVELTSQMGPRASESYGGDEERVAIMFADIRDSTRFAESLPPYDVIHALNKYFLRVGRAIEKHGDQMVGYQGDGLMALFREDGDANASTCAVSAGLDMFREVERLNPDLEAMHGRGFEIVVAVHYGEAVVGTLGYGKTRQLTAIGDAVNMAARIETIGKEENASLLVSQSTFDNLGGNFGWAEHSPGHSKARPATIASSKSSDGHRPSRRLKQNALQSKADETHGIQNTPAHGRP